MTNSDFTQPVWSHAADSEVVNADSGNAADHSPPRIAELEQRLALLRWHEPLSPGMLVTWKPGLRNKRSPSVGEPAIVIEVLASPRYDPEKSSGSSYFREPLDLVVGMFLKGDFQLFHVDQRRLMPYSRWLGLGQQLLDSAT